MNSPGCREAYRGFEDNRSRLDAGTPEKPSPNGLLNSLVVKCLETTEPTLRRLYSRLPRLMCAI